MMLSDADITAAIPALWRYARRLQGVNDPEDLLQTTCEMALRYRDRFRGDCPVEFWLIMIMRTENKRHHKRLGLLSEWIELEKAGLLEQPRQETWVWAGEVINAIEQLAPEHARILMLDAIGHSVLEMAQAEGISLEAGKSRLKRARACLARADARL